MSIRQRNLVQMCKILLWKESLKLQPHPWFFFTSKNWDFYTIRCVYLCSDCMLNFNSNFNLVTKIFVFFMQQPFLKVDFLKWPPLSWLLNLALFNIIKVYRKSEACLCSSLNRHKKTNWTLWKLWHFELE